MLARLRTFQVYDAFTMPPAHIIQEICRHDRLRQFALTMPALRRGHVPGHRAGWIEMEIGDRPDVRVDDYLRALVKLSDIHALDLNFDRRQNLGNLLIDDWIRAIGTKWKPTVFALRLQIFLTNQELDSLKSLLENVTYLVLDVEEPSYALSFLARVRTCPLRFVCDCSLCDDQGCKETQSVSITVEREYENANKASHSCSA